MSFVLGIDEWEYGVVSDCCNAGVYINGICSHCKDHCTNVQICALCDDQKVEMENGEPTSSFCNSCFFDVLDFKCDEMWIWEKDMKAFGFTSQDSPVQVINPFDSQWHDCSSGDYVDEMKEAQKSHKHLKKFKDIPSDSWHCHNPKETVFESNFSMKFNNREVE